MSRFKISDCWTLIYQLRLRLAASHRKLQIIMGGTGSVSLLYKFWWVVWGWHGFMVSGTQAPSSLLLCLVWPWAHAPKWGIHIPGSKMDEETEKKGPRCMWTGSELRRLATPNARGDGKRSLHSETYGLEIRGFLPIKEREGLPWWRSGWESAYQCRGHGFNPWSGKIPHAGEQLSPHTTTTELTL